MGDGTGIGYYVQLDARGLTVGGGFRAHSPGQIARFRAAVDDDATGVEVSDLVAELRGNGFDIEGEALKTKPRGYDADHPRIELLRCRSLMAVKVFGTPAWLASPAALEQVRDTWRLVAPLNRWVCGQRRLRLSRSGGPVSFSGAALKPLARPRQGPGPTLISIG